MNQRVAQRNIPQFIKKLSFSFSSIVEKLNDIIVDCSIPDIDAKKLWREKFESKVAVVGYFFF